jgi:hypothetical protein
VEALGWDGLDDVYTSLMEVDVERLTPCLAATELGRAQQRMGWSPVLLMLYYTTQFNTSWTAPVWAEKMAFLHSTSHRTVLPPTTLSYLYFSLLKYGLKYIPFPVLIQQVLRAL